MQRAAEAEIMTVNGDARCTVYSRRVIEKEGVEERRSGRVEERRSGRVDERREACGPIPLSSDREGRYQGPFSFKSSVYQ